MADFSDIFLNKIGKRRLLPVDGRFQFRKHSAQPFNHPMQTGNANADYKMLTLASVTHKFFFAEVITWQFCAGDASGLKGDALVSKTQLFPNATCSL